MDELQIAYDDYVSQRDKMSKNGFTFHCTVENGVLIADVTYDLTGFSHHFEVQDAKSGYEKLENSLINFEMDAYEKAEEGKNQREIYHSKEHLEELRLTAASYAKNEAAEAKMLDLFKAKDEAYVSLTEAPTQEKQDQYMSILDQLTEMYRDRDNYRTISEARAMKKELLQEQSQSKWNAVIEEFGQESPEAVVAMDMIELDDSVQSAEAMFEEASRETDVLESAIEAAESYANDIFVKDVDKRNFQMFDLRQDLAEEQIQEIVEKNPIVKEDQGMMDALKDTFLLQDIEGLSRTDLDSRINAFAKAQNDQFKAQHPILATIEALKEIPRDLKAARETVKASGMDYKTNVEKVADAVAMKAGAFYGSAKMSAVERLQSVAEKSASIYKEACNDFHELVGLAKKEAHKGLATVMKASDIVLDSVTLGAWSNHCEKLEDMAFWKEAKENGAMTFGADGTVVSMSMADPYTYQGQLFAMMEKDPNGILSRMENFLADDFSNPSEIRKVMNFVEAQNESAAARVTNLRHKILSGLNDYDSSTYWKEVNDVAFVELQGEKNPADLLKDLAEKINEKGFELDNRFGTYVNNKVSAVKKEVKTIKEDVAQIKDAVVDKAQFVFSREHVEEMKKSVLGLCNEAKESIQNNVDKVKNSVSNAWNKTVDFGKRNIDKVVLGAMAVKVMSLENTAALAEKTVALTEQAQRKCGAQMKALTEFDKIVHENMENINQAINAMSSITPIARKPYETSPYIQQTLDYMKDVLEPAPEVHKVIDRIEKSEHRKETLHNIKETIRCSVDNFKQKVVNFVQSAGAKAKLNEMHGWGKAAEAAIGACSNKMTVLSQVKDGLGKVSDTVGKAATQAMQSYQQKADDLADEYSR